MNSFNAEAFSEGQTRVTQSVITRKSAVAMPGYQARNYYDGVGIAPDIQADYMTRDNLRTFGTSFVSNFTSAIVALLEKK